MAKRQGGFLQRSKSITGKTFAKASIKPQNTRKIIRRYHLLINKKNIIYKKLSALLNTDVNDTNIDLFNKVDKENQKPTDDELLSLSDQESIPQLYKILRKIEFEINVSGGLEKYQIASLHGQESKRGSDSSKWLFDNVFELKSFKGNIKALEIGSLSTQNIISKFAQTTRIDLNSNEPGIQKQDFMDRPSPADDTERFDIISCSLVLNFVPTPANRGKMFRRFEEFLLKDSELALVFIVLPLSCLTNSRYFNKDRFTSISESLGFSVTHYHEAKKLVYLVLKWTGNPFSKNFPKKLLNDGPSMNNFCITLE